MIILHYNSMPFKNFPIQLISGGVLLWYFEHTVLYFCFTHLEISKDSFIVDFSLIQLMLLIISTKYYTVLIHKKVMTYF
jgi:hypothetical protein